MSFEKETVGLEGEGGRGGDAGVELEVKVKVRGQTMCSAPIEELTREVRRVREAGEDELSATRKTHQEGWREKVGRTEARVEKSVARKNRRRLECDQPTVRDLSAIKMNNHPLSQDCLPF
jgi:hypothetical protein